MTPPTNPLLVETSAVLAALDRTTRAHRRHFETMAAKRLLVSSIYIRKEAIRRWFVDYVRLAELVALGRTIEDALRLVSNEYSARTKGSYLNVLADLGLFRERVVDPENPRHVSRRIAEAAIQLLWDFDDLLEIAVANKCGCVIGALQPEIDAANLLGPLLSFCREFCEPIQDCPVNEFLGFARADSAATALANCEHVAHNREYSQPLTDFLSSNRHITCLECSRIGDPLIALEHAAQQNPGEYTLLHIDRSFDRYCACLNTPHQRLSAAVAVEGTPRDSD